MTERKGANAERPAEQGVDARELERIERLRDRTDEIELIISGLTTVALFTLPGFLFDLAAARFSHFSITMTQAVQLMLIVLPGLCYTLGACFAVHLMIRAYWAGLAGLHSAFPRGIDWQRVPGMGRRGRDHHRARLPDLTEAIARADHAASALFAVISMIALSMIWVSGYLVLVVAFGALLGALLDDADLALELASVILVALLVVPALVLWLLDVVIDRARPGLADRPGYRRVVEGLIRINGWVWPQRLILPVQLTLQSNTRPYLVSVLIALGSVCIVMIGQARYEFFSEFSTSSDYRYLDAAALVDGVQSAHYLDRRRAGDRLRTVPVLDSFEQSGAYLEVFIPYQPRRDDPVLDERCASGIEPLQCLRELWTVRLGPHGIEPGALLATERRDLDQRGLTGLVPLTGLAAGLYRLEITWNPSDPDDVDPGPTTYSLPFLFSPDQELGAREPEAGRSRVERSEQPTIGPPTGF